jgi:hypothetical protein
MIPKTKKAATYVPPEAVRWVLDHLYVPLEGHPSNAQEAHAIALGVPVRTVQRWRTVGLHLGMWNAPNKAQWETFQWKASILIQENSPHLGPHS